MSFEGSFVRVSEREFHGVDVLAIALVCRVSPRMQERLKVDAGGESAALRMPSRLSGRQARRSQTKPRISPLSRGRA